MAVSEIPAVSEQSDVSVRRPYTTPVLTVLGTVGELTTALMAMTGTDGSAGMWTNSH